MVTVVVMVVMKVVRSRALSVSCCGEISVWCEREAGSSGVRRLLLRSLSAWQMTHVEAKVLHGNELQLFDAVMKLNHPEYRHNKKENTELLSWILNYSFEVVLNRIDSCYEMRCGERCQYPHPPEGGSRDRVSSSTLHTGAVLHAAWCGRVWPQHPSLWSKN